MNPIKYENWLTEKGDQVVRKNAARIEILSNRERLLYEVWILDTEQRNGGVSQYFANRGIEQWKSLLNFALPSLSSFSQFANAVNQVVVDSSDPYQEVLRSKIDLDALYDDIRTTLVKELWHYVESPT